MRRFDAVKPPDVRERIEQEMRLDLRLHHPQARFEHAGVEAQAPDLGLAQGDFAYRCAPYEIPRCSGHAPEECRLACIDKYIDEELL